MFVDRHPFVFYSMVGVTLIAALLVAIAPLSAKFHMLRPEFVCLLVIYWIISVPQHIGVTFAFFTGLAQDLVEQTVWGGHALALAAVAYICLTSYQRIKSYSLWHQTAWVSVLVGMHQVIVNAFQSFQGYHIALSSLLASVIISTLLWPILLLSLRRVRRQLHLS